MARKSGSQVASGGSCRVAHPAPASLVDSLLDTTAPSSSYIHRAHFLDPAAEFLVRVVFFEEHTGESAETNTAARGELCRHGGRSSLADDFPKWVLQIALQVYHKTLIPRARGETGRRGGERGRNDNACRNGRGARVTGDVLEAGRVEAEPRHSQHEGAQHLRVWAAAVSVRAGKGLSLGLGGLVLGVAWGGLGIGVGVGPG